ncbi:galactose oxidase [Larkinella sp. VNQ87]|uniref:galactose oxidase n=1 Tax=Larkinella sp. VNQ87 TaxID=3400921 RepID=UPI003C053E02
MYRRIVRISFYFAALLLTPVILRAQSYGLRFVGHEEIQDARTSLDLTPEKPLCLDGVVDLSFDMALVPSYKTYFGYVFRIIQDEKHNLDLLYDQKALCFKMIIGERFSSSVIRLDTAHLFNQWNHFNIRFDRQQNTLQVHVNNELIINDKTPFTVTGCFKIFFGGNEFREFRSKDLPPMKVKDILITEDGEPSYRWPLQEMSGSTTRDEIGGRVATIKNAVWIRSLHNEWRVAGQRVLNGIANVAFDPLSETVYLVAADQLYSYSVRNQTGKVLPQKNPPPGFFRGSQAVFNPLTRKLYNVYVDQKAVSVYDPVAGGWSADAITPNPITITEYWHANKFIARFDTALYVLGGYGQLKYKNSIERYHFGTRQWETVPTSGDVYTPRYLAALGTTAQADTAYLIGGYGSLTGEQILNPKSSYDFLQYIVSENRFRKLYELEIPKTDFAFANSLVIDPQSNRFYGLIFPNQQFKSNLQLIRGSLSEPSYEAVGNAIPYPFHDVHSFADLFFCPVSRKLLAVTLYWNENAGKTDVKLYTISFPPNALEGPRASEKPLVQTYSFWLLGLGGLIIGALLLVYFRRRPGVGALEIPLAPRPFEEQSVRVDEALPGGLSLEPAEIQSVMAGPATASTVNARIFFFGNFQVVDRVGTDVTKSFTPLLKELFLLLALNSIGKQRGVPSEKLNELLWPDKSGRDAGNNRSVNMTKLRNLLEKVGGCSLSKESGYWKVEFDFSQIYVDYERYVAIINTKKALTKQTIIELGEITQRGPFLLNTEYYWLDDFKSDISNRIINTFLQYADNPDLHEDPELLIQITNFIFYYDPVNEDAIVLKCKTLALMGKHTLAKNAFEKFARDYKALYGEAYEQPFSTIIN